MGRRTTAVPTTPSRIFRASIGANSPESVGRWIPAKRQLIEFVAYQRLPPAHEYAVLHRHCPPALTVTSGPRKAGAAPGGWAEFPPEAVLLDR
jgi:hypothetical protein